MSFYHIDKGWEMQWFRKIASTAFACNILVAYSAALDTIQPATASSAKLVGICMQKVTAADADYAQNTRIPVMVPIDKGARMIGDIGTGTIAVTDEGNEIDLKDEDEADASASATDVLIVKKFLSSTRAEFFINKPQIV